MNQSIKYLIETVPEPLPTTFSRDPAQPMAVESQKLGPVNDFQCQQ